MAQKLAPSVNLCLHSVHLFRAVSKKRQVRQVCFTSLVISPLLMFLSATGGQSRYSIDSPDDDYCQAPFIVKDIEQLMPTCLVFQDIHCKPFPGNHGDRSNNGHIPSIISITAQVVISQSKVALQNTSLFFKWLNKASYPPRLASVWRQYCRFGLVPPDTRPSGLARELAN